MGKFTTAFLLLAGVLVVGAAGTAALAASHEDTRATLDDAGEETPGVVVMGEDMQSALVTALPWLGLLAVPIGIGGILLVVGVGPGLGSAPSRRRY